MTVLTSHDIGPELCKALQLPEQTVAFSIKVRSGEPVIIEVEHYVESIGDFSLILSKHNLVPAEQDAEASAPQA